MDYIYSRPRIKIVKFKKISKKISKKKKFILVFIITVIIITVIIKTIEPLFNRLCKEKAISTATLITNQVTTRVMNKYAYSDFITIHRDKNNNIKMIQSNLQNVNNFIGDVTEQIQNEINKVEDDEISIRLGSFTGINIFSAMGPKVPIKISTLGNIKTSIKSEFVNSGINQTLHRLYLEMECEISILTPFNTIEEKVSSELIIAENIIVGEIPSSYYNIEGVTSNEALELIE